MIMMRATHAISGGRAVAALAVMTVFAAGCGPVPAARQAAGPASSSASTATASASPVPASASAVPSCTGTGAATSTVQTGPGVAIPVPPLASVEFVSAQQGWVAGAGRVLTTSNAGRSWVTQYRGPAQLDQVDFVDAAHGWAVGTSDLLRTSDGGKVWTALLDPCPLIRSVHFVTPGLGYAVAGGSDVRIDGGVPAPVGGGELLMTADGGRGWRVVPGAPAQAQTVCFSSPADGFLGTPGRIWRTTDGGRHWSLSFTEPPRPGYAGHEPGETAVVECAGDSAAWVLFLGFGAALSHAPYIAYATQDAHHWHVLFEETYTESAITPEVHPPAGPGSYPGPFSAISPDAAAFIGWVPPEGFGAVPLEMVTGGGKDRSMRGNVGGITQAYGGAFISTTQGWVAGTDQTVPGHQGNYAIEATTDGGRTWTRQYQAG
jgi:photosystem II stability/assembly factor-like uncharacterized protein